MRYKTPENLTDYLSDEEFARMEARGATAYQMDARARSNAWREHRQNGALGRIRALCEGMPGDSVLLTEYRTTNQLGALIASAKRQERARFATRVERHDLTGEPIGVRVTFLGLE